MDRIDAMQAFVAVADLQGFAPAARKLGLSPSARDAADRGAGGPPRRAAAAADHAVGGADRCRRTLSGARAAHPGRCRGGRERRRGRAHPAGADGWSSRRRSVLAGCTSARSCRPICKRYPEVSRRPAAVGSHGQPGRRRASISRCGSAICPIRRWWRAMSARCGGSWWPRTDISRRAASRRRPQEIADTRHHSVRRHDRGARMALCRGRPRDPRSQHAALLHQQRRRRDPVCRAGRRADAGAGLSGRRSDQGRAAENRAARHSSSRRCRSTSSIRRRGCCRPRCAPSSIS